MTLYQNELEVAQRDVEVFANATAQAALQAVALAGTPKWQIGVADGTPAGFRYADLLPRAHPSDKRMSWAPVTYTVGSSSVGSFPAVQWRSINTPNRIDFTLAANEVRGYRLRIFVPLSQVSARPQISVNARWNGPLPATPNQPKTRAITRGTTRGNNTLYEVDIPARRCRPAATASRSASPPDRRTMASSARRSCSTASSWWRCKAPAPATHRAQTRAVGGTAQERRHTTTEQRIECA